MYIRLISDSKLTTGVIIGVCISQVSLVKEIIDLKGTNLVK